ncbi:ATP-binding protein [Saccharopolyspora shandongensis]|uniref:ATP-binding protein n=1 Tax=Saccharopolyspora shandongensis TaxID=418495 RepID=UPI0033FD2617
MQVLCGDELARRKQQAISRRLRLARIGQQATPVEFDFTASPNPLAAQIRNLASLRWLHGGEPVVLYGPVRAGKTHTTQGLGHQAIGQDPDVRFLTPSRLLADLAGGRVDRTWTNVYASSPGRTSSSPTTSACASRTSPEPTGRY